MNLNAEPVAVHYSEGSVHGFLALHDSGGKLLAAGDLMQVARGGQIVSHLVFHFKDGSIDDETCTFSQHGVFKLLSDHHIQKGPSFPKPLDVAISTSNGMVTVHADNKRYSEHLDLPADLANGVILNLLKNLSPKAKETKFTYVAATPKPRLVKLAVTPEGEDTFSVAGASHKAVRFDIRIELGGITGVIAPLVGKQPADINVWIAEGESPAFVKSIGPRYVGGPEWTVEMTSPVW